MARALSISFLLAAITGCDDNGDSGSDGGEGSDADSDSDSDVDSDSESEQDSDTDTVCEDVVLGCGYDPGCNGQPGPDGCLCSRDRPPQAQCQPDVAETSCDRCVSFGSAAFFCMELPGEGWHWQRFDVADDRDTCAQEDRCARRNCHGASGVEAWVCDGEIYRPEHEVEGCE